MPDLNFHIQGPQAEATAQALLRLGRELQVDRQPALDGLKAWGPEAQVRPAGPAGRRGYQSAKFGRRYRDWADRTLVFLPRWRQW